MFAMTAAHPTLPLPSYARVTNPANGRSVVLRVNDRGPFHAGRIMDLSYAAAYRLGYVNEGSVRVIVETLVPGDENFVAAATTPRTVAAVPATRTAAAAPPLDAEGLDILFRQLTEDSVSAIAGAVIEAPSQGIFLQLGAFANIENAENLKNRLISELEWLSGAIHLEQSGQLHRLQLGPYPSRAAAEFVAQRIREGLGYTPTIISR
jgi:rare lipoprotein A